MIWNLLGAGSTALFLFLYIRVMIQNSKLKNEITTLKGIIDVQKKQLEIAAQPPLSPDELLRRMRENTL
jgi:hypothetical protein